MITVRTSDGANDIYLPQVDHLTTAESAAQHLWEAIHNAQKIHGGTAFLFSPEDRQKAGWEVFWKDGPTQWADAYVVSEGADAREFVAEAVAGLSVVFTETD